MISKSSSHSPGKNLNPFIFSAVEILDLRHDSCSYPKIGQGFRLVLLHLTIRMKVTI